MSIKAMKKMKRYRLYVMHESNKWFEWRRYTSTEGAFHAYRTVFKHREEFGIFKIVDVTDNSVSFYDKGDV